MIEEEQDEGEGEDGDRRNRTREEEARRGERKKKKGGMKAPSHLSKCLRFRWLSDRRCFSSWRTTGLRCARANGPSSRADEDEASFLSQATTPKKMQPRSRWPSQVGNFDPSRSWLAPPLYRVERREMEKLVCPACT